MESVVFLHGFSGTRHAWEETIAALPPERYTPLALDLPGHGEQTDAQRPIGFEGCVASVLERSPDRFVLVGYSMGGRVGLHVALAAPRRVCGLVLVSATAGIEDPRERAERREADRRLAAEIAASPIEDFVERWGSQSMFAADPPEVGARARADQLRNRPDGVAAALNGIGTGEMQPLWSLLGELTMPVAVVAGERDIKFCELGRRMAAQLPDANLRIVAGGHRLPYEHPDAILAALAAVS
ncbi:MAG TPA: alpha/beta fold hydrolase [Solirubrobacteraceae bacterium]|nr:alpha/beta fold hydrolase [Solirubrobacteraceae bacterium]